MVDIPNSTTRNGFLRSVGDGSNASFWSPATTNFSSSFGSSSSGSIAVNSTPTALTPAVSVAVQGFSRYLVIFTASLANADTGGSHDGYIQIALDGTLVGQWSRTTLSKYAGGAYSYQAVSTSTVIVTTPGSHTIAGYGNMDPTTSSSGKVDTATLTIVGLS